MEQAPAVLILAAGKGARMKSQHPKVTHKVMGRALLEHVINAARYLEPVRMVVVTGFKADEVEELVRGRMAKAAEESGPELGPVTFVRQEEQLGTGHAVYMAREVLAGHDGPLVIMAGDVPLISPLTLMDFLGAHRALKADLSVLTVRMDDPASYGRIIRDENGWLEKIVEVRDATDEERQVDEINSGFYVADSRLLFEAAARLTPDNDQKEYYLTDVVADFRKSGKVVAAVEGPDPMEVQGINDRLELAAAQSILKGRINAAWMRAGVTMMDPASTYIEPGVRLSADVVLWPGVVLAGQTKIGPGSEIGPFCQLTDSRVGVMSKIGGHSVLNGARVGDSAELPPHSRREADAAKAPTQPGKNKRRQSQAK